MTDTPRTLAQVKTLLSDNFTRQISPQDARDFVESIANPILGGGFDNGQANIRNTGFAGGAKGDGATGDSAAIQAAFDSTAGTIVVPGGDYRIDTPLRAPTGKLILADGASPGYSGTPSQFRPIGGNTTIFDVAAQQLDRSIFMGLTFAGSGTETAFKGGSGGGIVSSSVWWCNFSGLAYDFDMGTNSQYLIVWQFYSKTNGPSKFDTNSYLNDNHWIGCTWNGVRRNVPAVLLHPNDNYGQGNWFQNSYFESCDRQAVVFYNSFGGVSSTYFEAINEDHVTYTAKDGRVLPLPAVDIQARSGVTLDSNFHIGSAGNEAISWGNSATSDAPASRLTLLGQGHSGQGMDASYIFDVDMPLRQFVSTRGDNSDMVTIAGGLPGGNTRAWDLWTPIGGNGGQHLPVDAMYADWFEFHRGSHGGSVQHPDPIIDNPTNASRGRELTFEFTAEDGYTISSITFGSAYKKAGAAVPPSATSKRRIYRFYFDGQSWVETYRSPADIG